MTIPRKRLRTLSRYSFYLLFLLAPWLDIFRFDLNAGHFVILGHAWIFGLEPSQYQCFDTPTQVKHLVFNFIVPVVILVSVFIFLSWKYGRLYCGWLCPHFSVVETINRLMEKYLGRVTLWEKPLRDSKSGAWLLILLLCLLIAFIWAFTILSYVLPPFELFHDLLRADLTFGPSVFLLVMTLVLTLDFFFARHLFCKYGCSVGMLQSFAWMGNPRALVIGFDKSRASLCQSCDNECDKACPMRLPVRGIKRAKITCTQCGVCLTACDSVQEKAANNEPRVINWVSGDKAVEVDRKAAGFDIKRLKKST